MYIKNIKFENFRNYIKEDISFHKNINVILGNNGQGKTNLLEGIYFFSMGKSFRTNKDLEIVNFDKDFSKVKGKFFKDNEDLEIEIGISKYGKSFKIDNVEKKKHADLLENTYIVIFSTEDLKVVKEDPEKRRKFMDRELCLIRPLYYKYLYQYKKIILQRNAILKKGDVKEEFLEVWDDNLVKYGIKLIEERKEFIIKLNKISEKIHLDITNKKESLKINYESNIEIAETLEEQKKNFKESLIKSRKNDIKREFTSVGPHKDDFKISISGIDVRKYGSQGQQRTAALSLKLAEVKIIKEEVEEDAIILLDDVLSELDKERQNYLINSFRENQIFISAAEISEETIGNISRGSIYYIENGKVEKIKSLVI